VLLFNVAFFKYKTLRSKRVENGCQHVSESYVVLCFLRCNIVKYLNMLKRVQSDDEQCQCDACAAVFSQFYKKIQFVLAINHINLTYVMQRSLE